MDMARKYITRTCRIRIAWAMYAGRADVIPTLTRLTCQYFFDNIKYVIDNTSRTKRRKKGDGDVQEASCARGLRRRALGLRTGCRRGTGQASGLPLPAANPLFPSQR